MNPIELITGLPKWSWRPHSQQEIILNGEDLVDSTDFVYRIGTVAVAGFIYHSFLSPPWMWFLLADKVNIGDLVDFRRLVMRFVPKGTLTAVKADYKIGFRFAELYGFKETGEVIDYSGVPYKVMRKL